jgi:hypothetical protein
MQQQAVTIYRPTVLLQKMIVSQNDNQKVQAGNKHYFEMNAVTCKAFSIVCARNTNHEPLLD